MLINDLEGPEPAPGEFRWARMTQAGDYDLVARLGAERFAEFSTSLRAEPSPGPRGAQGCGTGSGLVQIQPLEAG